MWLINFHLGFSILLLAAYIGIGCMFRKDVKKKISGLKQKRRGYSENCGTRQNFCYFCSFRV
ncbi:predicted protein [Anaerostipes caccae]|nr:predicted protein [Anaerostipes caccae]